MEIIALCLATWHDEVRRDFLSFVQSIELIFCVCRMVGFGLITLSIGAFRLFLSPF